MKQEPRPAATFSFLRHQPKETKFPVEIGNPFCLLRDSYYTGPFFLPWGHLFKNVKLLKHQTRA
jgi:hypothetical protein